MILAEAIEDHQTNNQAGKEVKKLYHMKYFEEVYGKLIQLSKRQDVLVAYIGKLALVLPLEIEPQLRPLLGSQIGILRTDDSARPYLFREVADFEQIKYSELYY